MEPVTYLLIGVAFGCLVSSVAAVLEMREVDDAWSAAKFAVIVGSLSAIFWPIVMPVSVMVLFVLWVDGSVFRG